MKISVVIPTYNRWGALVRCLGSLSDQDIPYQQFEVVVIVDGSVDQTIEVLRNLETPYELIVVYQWENRGQAAARNIGARRARGEMLLFLDDDMTCDPKLLSLHLAAHTGGATQQLVFGRTRSIVDGSFRFASQESANRLDRYYERIERDRKLKWPDDAWAGQNCSMRRTAFLESGGYDELRFPRRFEDAEFGMRLWKNGIQFAFEPEAVVWHRWTKTDHQVWNDGQMHGTGTVALCRMRPELRPMWGFVGVTSGSAWKRHLARALATSPWLVKQPLGILTALFERLPAWSWLRLLGSELYRIRLSVASLAGAQREAGSWRNLEKLFGPRLPILAYHHIGSSTPFTKHHRLTVHPRAFERHVRWIRTFGYTPITPTQWLAWREAGSPIPGKPVLLTFDDAYADVAKYALPVLERLGFGAAIFVITDHLSGDLRWEGLAVMNADEIRYWAARGMEIGVHTRSHPDLTAASVFAMRSEVAGSKRDLIDIGVTPVSFAYPYGSYDERVLKAVMEQYRLAFTVDRGVNDLRTDPFLMKRTLVHPTDTIIDFALRLRFGWSPRDWLNWHPKERLSELLRSWPKLRNIVRKLGVSFRFVVAK